MGKDSLLKSTSKKKTAKSAAAKTKKPKPDPKAKKVAPKKKAPKTKVRTKKAVASTTKQPVKAKAAAGRKAPAKAAKKTRASEKKLVLRKFGTWKPVKPFRVETAKPDLPKEAPPFVSGADEQETRRLRELLFKKFDLTTTDAPVSGPAAPEIGPAAARPSKPDDSRPFTQKLDPAAKLLTLSITGLVILAALVIAASSSNRSNFYIQPADGAVEIWQGSFAPLGKGRILVLPGSQPPEVLKAAYTKNEIYAFVFNYYLEKSDTLLDAEGMPDFEGIKLYLNMARTYAVTEDQRTAVGSRLNSIDLMTYLYKADVAASKGTVTGLENALKFLNMAAALKLDAGQSELVAKKIQAVKDLQAGLKPPQPEPVEQPAAVPPKE